MCCRGRAGGAITARWPVSAAKRRSCPVGAPEARVAGSCRSPHGAGIRNRTDGRPPGQRVENGGVNGRRDFRGGSTRRELPVLRRGIRPLQCLVVLALAGGHAVEALSPLRAVPVRSPLLQRAPHVDGRAAGVPKAGVSPTVPVVPLGASSHRTRSRSHYRGVRSSRGRKFSW